MAKGDTKRAKPASSGYSGRRGHTSAPVYNDQGRGNSKTLFEIFERHYLAQANKTLWLLGGPSLEVGLTDDFLYKCVYNMTWRHGIHDWAAKKYEDNDDNDGRVRRLVVITKGVGAWRTLQARAKLLWDTKKEEQRQADQERAEEWSQQQAVFDAERIERQTKEVQFIQAGVELVSGALRGDFQQAFTEVDQYYQEEGEWLDDPVSGNISGAGFGVEDKQASGTKLQITISLDLSNSMQHNKLAIPASEAFRDIYLSLEALAAEMAGDLFVAAFEFADNGYQDSQRGKVATNLTRRRWVSSYDHKVSWSDMRCADETKLGAVEAYRFPSNSRFCGEDTWFYPLFEEIEQWENTYSDPGAHRLDLVLTDAVIEHKSDIKRSDIVQERRDGSLQTVLLNFLPENEWVDSDLPKRCVQYAVTSDNIAGILRNVVSEFVGLYL